jgi:cephalosporin hydroxylase
LHLELDQSYDTTFIDTWHVYGHLKRELDRWNSFVSKYIILHDTTVDEWQGESLRVGWNPYEQSKQTGIPVEEIFKGLWPAVEEFLTLNPEWQIEKRYTNNNGLTILKRN